MTETHDQSQMIINTGLGPISSIVYSPDGTKLLLGLLNNTSLLLDPVSGRWLAILRGHGQPITCLAFGDRFIVTGSLDQSVFLWDIHKLTGTRTVSLANGQCVELWDANTSTSVTRIRVSGQVWKVAMTSDARLLAIASGREVGLWRVAAEGAPRSWSVQLSSTNASCLAFSHDGKLLGIGGEEDYFVKLVNSSTGEDCVTLRSHEAKVTGLAFLRNNTVLVSSSVDGSIKIWELSKTSPTSISLHSSYAITSLALSPDKELLAVGCIDKSVQVWGLPEKKKKAVLRGHEDQINCVQFSPDGKQIAASSCDGKILIWKAPF